MKTERRIRHRRGKMDWRKIGAVAVATMLVVALVIGLVPDRTVQVLAADRTSDLSTTTKYAESLGDNASTEYAGRIWTDKTVYTEDATLTGYSGSSQTIKIGNDDFLVGFSALATSQSISGEEQAPMDVVFIIDISGSMSNSDSNMTNSAGQTYSRIKFTVDAVNNAIDEIMALNSYTRVGVVGFSNSAVTLLPLDRYTKSNNTAYFTLSRNTGSDNNVDLYTRAVNSSGRLVSSTEDVEGGTNTQKGIYQGMNLLATASSTKATINGKEVQRVPAVILLSDGASTYSQTDRSWWAPTGTGTQGPGSSAYYGNGMLAMMTGAYMKAAVDSHYGVTGTAYDTTIYTVGMGINDLVETGWWGNITDTSQRDLARVTLNPGQYFDDANNDYAKDIKDAWERYCGVSGRDTTPDIDVSSNGEYTLNHPESNDISGDALKTYVDRHYDADDADSVATVFEDIVSDIAISTPMVPTEHDAANPATTGYITYTDPIGKYMEVKDMKAIVYAGQKYEAHSVKTDGDITTYTFTETAEGNAVYGSEELSNILIEVKTSTDNRIKTQVLTIKIPASLIPLRVNTVHLSGSESTGYTVKSHTNNGAYPIRVFYTVGLQEEVMDGNIVATHKLDTAYVKANSNADGTINFYSNLYTGQKSPYDNDITIGDATVVFDADSSNPFYYTQEDILIYEDVNFRSVADGAQLDDNATYYYKEVHYHGTAIETEAVARTGAQLKNNTEVRRYPNGQWYRPAGTVRVNRMLTFEGTKIANATNTADDFYTPTYNEDMGYFVVYLGNNGVMSAIAGGSLAISKTVTADEGLEIQPDREFTFTVNLKDGNASVEGEYVYVVTNAAGEEISTDTISDGGTLKLKHGETATILSLPPDTDYEVTEINVPDGFTPDYTGKTGKIETGVTAQAEVTNRYSVEPVQFPADGQLTGTKVLEGRPWDNGVDAYTFLLTPYNNAPLPEDYDTATGVTVTTSTGKTADGKWDLAVFDLGVIEYTKPGTYRYTIVEKEPENDAYIAGISYSRALYRVVVEVVDNKNGTLTASSNIQKLYTDDATELFSYDENNNIVMNAGQEGQDAIVFTNKFSQDAIVRVPVATKAYTDNSGNNPLVSGMFEFKLEPMGYLDAQNNLVEGTASSNPMPLNPNDNNNKYEYVVTTNEGINITFPGVAFSTEDAQRRGGTSTTYRYRMTEVLPSGANEENNYTVNGMKYDAKEVFIDVTVSIDDSVLNVNAVYPGGQRITTFENEYTPNPTTATVEGTKTLTGRDMQNGETFDFAITPSNAVMNLAIREGAIIMPSDATASVSGGEDGKAVAFAFDEITFTKPGVYTFNVSETIPDPKAGGVTYDEHICAVTVTVTDENGQLEAVVTYNNGIGAADNTKAVFANTYVATFDDDTAISLSGTKIMTGRPIEEGEFYFEVTLDNGARASYVPATTTGAIQFLDKMTYTEAGTYVYYISEVIPNPGRGGMTYDRATYRVTVEVIDNFKGTLSAAITDIEKKSTDSVSYESIGTNGAITFENIYKADSETVDLLGISKVISGTRGQTLRAGEFTFKLTLVSGDAEGIALPSSTTTNRADGTVVFGDGKLIFSKVGTYVIQVEEVVPDDATENADGTYTKNGITYSTNVIRSTFEVTDNLEGDLIVTRTGTIGSREFINTYNTTGTLKGSTDLVVVKNFTGREGDAWLDNDSFSFVLEAHDEVTKTAIANGKIVMPTNATGIIIDANDTDKKAAFGDIIFYEAGTYTFGIREEAGTIPGVEYDATSRTIKVVTTDQSNGTLLVTATGNSESELTFNNVYKVDEVLLYGHGNLHVTKEFTGREDNEWLDTDSFTFTLAIDENDEDTKSAYDAGNIVMTSTQLTINHDNKDYAHFGNITFKQVGRFQFIVDEVEGNIPGVKYDETTKTVIVNVIDRGDGTLAAALMTSSEALTFTNTYKAESTDAALEGLKKMTGRKLMSSDIFEFTLRAIDNAPMPAVVTAENNAEGEIKFASIIFEEAGVYVYEITETGGSAAGVTDVTDNVVATVTVEDDKVGKLVVTSIVYSSAEGNGFVYTNQYTTTETDGVTINGKKLVSPTAGNNYTMVGEEFTFEIAPFDTNPGNDPIVKKQVKNAADGTIIFAEDAVYKQEGTYRYTVHELTGNVGGIGYDDTIYIVTVEVTDDKANAKLHATVSYAEENASAEKIEFNNSYNPTEASVIPYGKKVLDSEHIQLVADKFQFKLEAIGDNAASAPMPESGKELATNDGSGNFQFGKITYKAVGEYTYQITEVNSGDKGYTYDDTKYTITVKVTDNNGELTANVTGLENQGEAAVVFTNGYTPDSVTLEGDTALGGKKKLSGREMKADEFTFQLIDKDNQVVAEDKNDANGNFKLEPVTFSKAGTYYYTIVEKDTELGGVTYDETVYTVKVEVTDAGGYLEADVTYLNGSDEADVVFENSYKTQPVGIRISAAKALTGRELKAGEFTFLLKNAAGEIVAKATNDANGLIVFEEIKYDKAGTYEYTVSEEKGNAEHVTYDDSVYKVTITVTDDLVGAMKAEVDYHGANPAFNNSYEEPQSVIPTGDFAVVLPIMMMAIAAGVMVVTLKKRREAR